MDRQAANVRTLDWDDLDPNALSGAGDVVRRVSFWQKPATVVVAYSVVVCLLLAAFYSRFMATNCDKASSSLHLFFRELQSIEGEAQDQVLAKVLKGEVAFQSYEIDVRAADFETAGAIGSLWTDIRREALVPRLDGAKMQRILKQSALAVRAMRAKAEMWRQYDLWLQIAAGLAGILMLILTLRVTNRKATTLVVQSVVSRGHDHGRASLAPLGPTPASSQTTLDSVPRATCRIGNDGAVLEWNQRMAALIGISGPDSSGRMVSDLLGWSQIGDVAKASFYKVFNGELVTGLKWKYAHPSGETVALTCDMSPILSSSGVPTGAVLVVEDESYRNQQYQTMVDSEMVRSAMLSALPDTLMRFDAHGNLVELHDNGQLFDAAGQILLGKAWQDAFPEELRQRIAKAFKTCRLTRSTDQFVYAWEHMGKALNVEFRVTLCGYTDILAVLSDVSEHIKLEQELARRVSELQANNDLLKSAAVTDPLTGLLNIQALHQYLQAALSYAAACDDPVSVALIEIQNLKQLNQSAGFEKGDDVLKWVAAQLSANCREEDAAFHSSGKEFYWILPSTDLGETEKMLARILTVLSGANPHGCELQLAASALTLAGDQAGPNDVCEKLDRLAAVQPRLSA